MKIVEDQLRTLFPTISSSLQAAPWVVIYEVTRVRLHAEVSEISFSNATPAVFRQYEEFWRYIRAHPELEGKPFPEKCSKEAWEAGFTGDAGRFNGVVLSGVFQLQRKRISRIEPPLQFRLHPLKINLNHRAGRSLGSDRFLEIDIPSFTRKQVPMVLANLGEDIQTFMARWLLRSEVELFGRSWKSFYNAKLKAKKKKKGNAKSADPGNRVYFFAINGGGFKLCSNPPVTPEVRYTMSIKNLVDFLLPIQMNREQSHLKFFSRISLVLSRNWATVVLDRSQIIDRDDGPSESNPEHIMTHRAGRISPALAEQVAQELGLLYLPSGFQGRIGEAKGFWTVDYSEKSDVKWIETCASQRKWKRSIEPDGVSEHKNHRTSKLLDTLVLFN